ncbi:MAG: NFACT RNA binding domain-containing protein [Bacteroidota bacterium]
MLSNYFTLYHIADRMHALLRGSVVAEVYSQEKNTLSLLFYTPDPVTVTVSCIARNNFISVRPGIHRAKKNSVDLFPLLIDMHVEQVYLSATDRIVYIKVAERRWLAVEMFSSKANILLIDESGAIADAFMQKKELHAVKRILQQHPQPVDLSNLFPDRKEFFRTMDEDLSLLSAMKKTFSHLGATVIKEILFTLALDGEAPSRDVSESLRGSMYEEALKTASVILRVPLLEVFIYFDDTVPVCFSLLPLRHLAEYRRESYSDIFSAVQRYISFSRSSDSFHENKQAVTQWIKRELGRTKRTIDKITAEASSTARAEEYELFGKALTAHLHEIPKGSKKILLADPFSPGSDLSIPLDPALSPARNAERYYEKAKHAKAAAEDSLSRLEELRRRENTLTGLQRDIDGCSDSVSLKKFLHSHENELKQLGFMTAKEQEELPPFKIFTVEGGFTVYAGKSSENNDLLTVKFARPNDLWFHARGSSGSHVILRTGTGNGDPSKKAIEQAASIAAYYSKMKNAKHVPVAMCEKKYVRKPKGVPAGTVVIEREKVIFVEPKLPG